MPKYDAVGCFWVEPNGKAERTLRRYARTDEECPANPGQYSYHNVSVPIGIEDVVKSEDGYLAAIDVEDYEGDERWPSHCDCGYEFKDDDNWQVNQQPIYISEDGRETSVTRAGGAQPVPGAMFHTWWRENLAKEDGLAITVICPDGTEWCIDSEASSGGHWTRTGEPPKITARPSILTPDYHGWLDDGVLSADIDS